MERLVSLLGLFVMIAIAWSFSEKKKAIQWRTVISGIVLQIVFGLIILKTGFGRAHYDSASQAFIAIREFTNEGSKFLFGNLSDPSNIGFVFATMVPPTIIFMSSMMSVLYQLGLMQKAVEIFA